MKVSLKTKFNKINFHAILNKYQKKKVTKYTKSKYRISKILIIRNKKMENK